MHRLNDNSFAGFVYFFFSQNEKKILQNNLFDRRQTKNFTHTHKRASAHTYVSTYVWLCVTYALFRALQCWHFICGFWLDSRRHDIFKGKQNWLGTSKVTAGKWQHFQFEFSIFLHFIAFIFANGFLGLVNWMCNCECVCVSRIAQFWQLAHLCQPTTTALSLSASVTDQIRRANLSTMKFFFWFQPCYCSFFFFFGFSAVFIHAHRKLVNEI